jgi:hypothetical protein
LSRIFARRVIAYTASVKYSASLSQTDRGRQVSSSHIGGQKKKTSWANIHYVLVFVSWTRPQLFAIASFWMNAKDDYPHLNLKKATVSFLVDKIEQEASRNISFLHPSCCVLQSFWRRPLSWTDRYSSAISSVTVTCNGHMQGHCSCRRKYAAQSGRDRRAQIGRVENQQSLRQDSTR